MDEKKLAELKEQYPPEFFKVTEKSGKLVINERKAVIWLPKRFAKALPEKNPKALSDHIETCLENTSFDALYFEAEQKLITQKCSKAVADKAKECNCTKYAFIVALLERNSME